MCPECYERFDPHYQPGLFWLSDGYVSRVLE